MEDGVSDNTTIMKVVRWQNHHYCRWINEGGRNFIDFAVGVGLGGYPGVMRGAVEMELVVFWITFSKLRLMEQFYGDGLFSNLLRMHLDLTRSFNGVSDLLQKHRGQKAGKKN